MKYAVLPDCLILFKLNANNRLTNICTTEVALVHFKAYITSDNPSLYKLNATSFRHLRPLQPFVLKLFVFRTYEFFKKICL